ncbi:MAG: hypoxanthine phosphoribosyltransferase [Christensenellales bacterium]|jgi:hypoxanthine phosphoribosyltransferase
MENCERHIIVQEEQLRQRICELGRQITQDYADIEPIVIGVLKGSLYFLADLTRRIDLPLQLDFISINAIPHTTSHTGIVRIIKDVELDITGKHVILVEDIIRTGLTTAYLIQTLDARKPASINLCSLLLNPRQQLINLPIRYFGFEISDERLIGYGLDIHEKCRNLPYIAALEPGEI